ncbi:MAG TPA: YbaB/EbfC family nucleoid-associated protein [Proteobacteria bacterium]|jgi:DNA-binding YbaB/EbfC family protein|nr:YbaB/EbfC family nucleoid-associated protein [Pseudomonadota bacterium]
MAKGMGNLLKQAQQMQAKMAKIQEEVGARTVEAAAGGGMVKVVANGRQEILSISIEPQVVDPDDIDMLQDLVVAAVNQALKEAGEMMAAEMGKVTGGIKVPGLTL